MGKWIAKKIYFHNRSFGIRKGRMKAIGFDFTEPLKIDGFVNSVEPRSILWIILSVFPIWIENQLSNSEIWIHFSE